ncbi:LSU ribosomal protein L28P [Borrelia duttonii CR2A]|uniref:LSU ribosomal protein L28P n=1 Tax=Borrelia duttonii CR2A TaxID=1432657 RepID=W6TIM5_9SPIR|nr:LSU ribosomal protein L28P [Borrelia duttonii CR2A]
MGRECEITGKRTMFGNNVPRKGLAKRKVAQDNILVLRLREL